MPSALGRSPPMSGSFLLLVETSKLLLIGKSNFANKIEQLSKNIRIIINKKEIKI